jgi:hypothetical protein
MAKKQHFLSVFLSILLLSMNAPAELRASQPFITFAIGAGEEKPIYKALDQISSEAFAKMNVGYRSIPCIPTRCGQMVTQNMVDGEPVRPGGYSHFYPQLLRVDASIVSMSIVAIVKDPIIQINAISDLEDHDLNIGFQHGYRNFDLLVPRYVDERNIVRMVHWREGLEKLDSGDIDVLLALKQIAVTEIPAERRAQYMIADMQDALELRTYPFLNQRYDELRRPLEDAINEMKASGRIRAIFEQHGIPTHIISD